MDIALIKGVSEYGFATAILVIFFFLLKWVLHQQEKILEQARIEREGFIDAISGISDIMKQHIVQEESHSSFNNEAHRYQREEHIRMLEHLQQVSTALDSVSKNFIEQGVILSRINGHNK